MGVNASGTPAPAPEDSAIESVGVYTPRYRIDAETIADALGRFEARGISIKSVPAGDEDTVTMGVEAAERTLSDDDVSASRGTIETLVFATTTPPYEEFDVGATVADLLGLPEDVRTQVFTQSTNAGVQALRAGFEAAGPSLVVVADAPRGDPDSEIDHAAGAGAVAFLLTTDGSVEFVDAATHTEEYPGTRFRESGSDTVNAYGATAYEREAFSGPIAATVGKLQDPSPSIAMTAPDGNLPYRALRGLDFDAELSTAVDELGDLGAASALFGLVAAWTDGTERVTLVGYGDGATVDALVLDGTLPTSLERETERIGYGAYLRKRGLAGHGTGGGR